MYRYYTTIMKSHSIEEMAKKLTKLKAQKEKLDNDIINLQSELDEYLKTLGISPKIIYMDNYPTTYIPQDQTSHITLTRQNTEWVNTQPLLFDT